MSIVTITSDWNSDDYYSAAVKGKILSRCPDTTLVNITNQVPPFGIAQAAFQLRHAYRHFPAGSVHLIAVNSETKEKQAAIALKANEHYFIGNDNGIFGLILDEDPDEVVQIDCPADDTFPELSVFAEAVCDLLTSGKLGSLGKHYKLVNKRVPMLPTIDESVINGSVVYIDSYKNALTNINRELFDQIGKGRPFEIFIQSNHYRINRLNERYSESSLGEMVALFNSIGLLEIAINGGNAAELLNLSINSPIRIKFRQS